MTEAEGQKERRRRHSREVVRLGIALVLLLVAAISSALTGAALGGGPAGPAGPAGYSLLRRGPAEPGTLLDVLRGEVVELERRDQAFRLIAGLETADAEPEAAGTGVTNRGLARVHLHWSADRTAARQAYGVPVDLRSVIRRTELVPFSWREAEDSLLEYRDRLESTLLEYRDRLESTPAVAPANGYISSGFSPARMHPILDLPRPHRGLDIVAPYGSPIVATARGQVSFVGQSGAYGLTIEIEHGHGIMTRYAHASRALVRAGQQVVRGDTIARVGRSGLAVGSHVHYEVLVNGEPTNPRRYIRNPNPNPD